MKSVKMAMILGVSVLALTACGAKAESKAQDNMEMAKTEQTQMMDDKSNENMSDEEMTDDKMMDDKSEDKMSGDKMKDNMSDKKMDDKMMDDKKGHDKMSGDKMKDNMSDKKMDDKMMDDKKGHDKMSGDKMKDNMSDKKMDDKKATKSVEKMNDGDIAPDMILKDKDGKEVKLSQMTGKKVYVKFWASWCPVCLSGLEELNELAGQNNDFEIVTVVAPGINGEKSKADFIQWFDSLGHKNIKVLYDESGDAIKTYGVRAYPTSVAVGSDGVLIGVQPGHLSADMIKDIFTKVK
ncbi:MAG: redoxin family protein [Peptostreptococcaceae bacterium]|nr:redoxin family protein [Peptostreptococcaceae bacterium]